MSAKFIDAIAKLESIQLDSFATDAERYEAKEATRRLLARLETPFETGWALAYENPVLIAGLQVGIDLGIWVKWAAIDKETGGAAKTLNDILGMSNRKIEPNVLRRFLKHLAALYILEETDADTYKPTAFSLALGDTASHIDQTVQAGNDHTIPTGVNLPRFLAKHDYQEPLDKTKFDNYADTFGDDFFALNQKDPSKGSSFIGLMTALRNYKMDWTEVYNTNKLVEGADLTNDAPLFVDVGGAHGLDTGRLLARHPDLPADVLILQDLPDVIAMKIENIDERIKRMAYDFFTPQPVVGSRAYFFHAVPHDWPDADCLRIFGNVAKAMKKGYSKLLVYEVVLPAKGATSLMTTLDLQLMNAVSGLERTEEHWKELLEKAGFRIVSIDRHPRAVESVIEAELV